ncbi:ABC transporter permease [Phytomonospora sp. NPDC050363]|uniref:ABC transporter permease n=1 Tax=Phytomonospora sp. NPDC050363 TaxID=3155642 RepID=UPI0033D09E6F
MTTFDEASPSLGSHLYWAIRDGWTITTRGLVHWIRNPAVAIGGLLYPIVMVALFGLVLGSAMTVEGGGDYAEFLMPGMFAQAMANGVMATMAMISSDASRGVTDRFRTMPMSQTGVVLGRSFADMINSVLELIILLGCGLAIGWTWHGTWGAALSAVGLLLLLRFAMIWVGIYLGLFLKPEAAGAAWMVLMPITMLANTFVSPEQLPGWLAPIAEWNPLSATVAASRELFGNPGVVGGSWPADNALLLAIVWPLVAFAVFLPLCARKYRRLSR